MLNMQFYRNVTVIGIWG